MQSGLLHMDEALKNQPELLALATAQFDLREQGGHLRLWAKDKQLNVFENALAKALAQTTTPRLTFLGSGDFHHLTACLIKQTVKAIAEPITVIQFDQHPDWVKFKVGMHCGSWVQRALQIPQVAKLITIGVTSNDLVKPASNGAQLAPLKTGKLEVYPYQHPPSQVRGEYGSGACYTQKGRYLHWKNITEMGLEKFTTYLLSRIETMAVYITVDKDVLSDEAAQTNWDQGHMQLADICQLIKTIGRQRRIIGADVIGDYSLPHYAGPIWQTLPKRIEAWLDQPRAKPNMQVAVVKNTKSNLALYQAFAEVMA